MSLLYIPDVETIVLTACADLISQFSFVIQRVSKDVVILSSDKCAIKIVAGISPIGEHQIDIDFFRPTDPGPNREYYSHTFLLYINTRSEPDDVLRKCVAAEEQRNQRYDNSFDETLHIALKCFTAHTLKYRQDILNGDFTSWLPKPRS